MKPILLALLLVLAPEELRAAAPEGARSREVSLARELIEDAAIRWDDEGLRLGRERAARLAAEAEAAGEARVARDAHYLIALAAWAQLYTGNNEIATLVRIAEEGFRHADRAAALDAGFADAFAMGGADRAGVVIFGERKPELLDAMMERIQQAVKLDPTSPPGAYFKALMQSMNPAGPAAPAGLQAFGELVRQLDARLAAGGVRPGFWDVHVRAWDVFVRLQSEKPDVDAVRADLKRLLALRPDSALARELARRVEHRSWAPASAVDGLAWKALGSDAAGDGKNAAWPDLRSLELARGGDRVWFRLTFEQGLPPSFGLNLAIDRNGDPGGDAKWWGGGSTFRYDRLVTAWVVGEGDGYFGVVGVADAVGPPAMRMVNLSTELLLRLGEDGKSVMVGVPAGALALAAGAKVVGAGGSNLMWNDNLTAEGGDGIEIPAQ